MSNYPSRFQVRFKEFKRRTIHYLGGFQCRDIEYDFVYRHVFGEGVSVLDVGGCESLLALQFAKRGYSVTVQDFRKYPEKHPNLSTIQGDFLTNTLPNQSFDFVVMVSAIEHMGFGSYGAPIYKDGDFLAMEQIKRILKPSGRIVLTFPIANKEIIVTGFERWYDIKRLQHLFEGMYILAEEYYVPSTKVFGKIVKWLPASLEQISDTDDVIKRYGYQCNACLEISPVPIFPFLKL
jgi:2-polyprenyl-3-methyl-5-hydroxy-6-metoxy-1,4-benzoquinol methylase